MSEVLRVDTAAVTDAGTGFFAAAGRLPTTVDPFTAAGGDALSTAGLSRQQSVETPLTEALPITGRAAVAGGDKITRAAHLYAATDSRLSARLNSGLQVGDHDGTPPSTSPAPAGEQPVSA
ncbi:hypothetical protein KIH27_14295 [Mycobacterium sp. M1]|uniref:ESX-1 secretion-associated protein n=1 Tax=Mycolicibacter acidiphilus TaxID=2835306 RepID=A0ABS5RKD7_9MYCO|nr:hypothetical protein [Mycolicibacter acidiphilus]MBS9534760.1 hypothetical protein [Mycolicibacter acidiphilus]